ncbi:MAG: C40 family peptidase [Firmicutes bacterium]|nr:C40 family peptidase [Bacillota bacterium]
MKLKNILGLTLITGLMVLGFSITAYAQAKGIVTENGVNLRSGAGTSHAVLTTLDKGTTVVANKKVGNFFELTTANYGTAYISDQYFQVTFVTATVLGDEVNVRKSPSTGSESLGVVYSGEEMIVTDVDGDWCTMKYGDGEAYIHRDYVASDLLDYVGIVPEQTAPQEREIILPPANLSLAEQMIHYAKQFIGVPYVWGGTDLNKGVDCSGFVYCVMQHFGIQTTRTSRSLAKEGVYVPRDQLQMGDLVFFDCSGVNDGNIGHVGIYISNGDYIHSSSGKVYGVTINSLNEDYSNRTYVTARRVF